MSKAKGLTRQAAPVEPEEVLAQPEAWRRWPWLPYLILVAVLAVVFGAGLAVDRALQPVVPPALAGCKTSNLLGPHEYAGRQPICIVYGKSYTATLKTTQGDIVIKLLPQYAPATVNNFVVLAVNGYYNGLQFWDSQSWEVQGGDPLATGRGGPGYDLWEERTPTLSWSPGAVGMARVPGGPVNGSQFFITKATWPNGGPAQVYNRFGTVVQGLDKVSALSAGDRINTITIKVS
jgi:peptidyl-prolyl cis-trans isomerase B (cyclophilin B)